MKVGKGYAGFESLFILGVLAASYASLAFSQIYNAASSFQLITIGFSSALICTSLQPGQKTSAIILYGTAITAGIYCGLNGRIISLTTDNANLLTEALQPLGKALQSAIDDIPFMSRDTNALLKALLSGDRSDLPDRITGAFRSAGGSHILALSGLHLGIIYAITESISSVFGNSPKSRVQRSVFKIGLCTSYSLATGASASIIRALLFIILRETGIVLGRPVTLKDLIRKCLLIHLVISPHSILEVGFQLSYAAIAGIAWIYPHLKSLWPEGESWPIMKKTWDSAALTISCQLTTAPLAWLYFNTFPTYFLLTNLLALPLTGILIPISILTVALNAAGLCPAILTEACEKTASCLIHILTTISLM
jgi:ComEC/Rec2-related protein